MPWKTNTGRSKSLTSMTDGDALPARTDGDSSDAVAAKTYGSITFQGFRGTQRFLIDATPDATMRLKRIMPK